MAAVLVLAGCSTIGGSGANAVFDSRRPLPACGSTELRINDLFAVPPSTLRCLARPQGGEAMVQTTTVEGDPIRTYFRVGPGIDGIEYYTDHTRDAFGEQVWTYTACPEAVVADLADPAWLECRGTSALPAA